MSTSDYRPDPSVADVFLDAIKPTKKVGKDGKPRKPKHAIDDHEFAEFVMRMVRRLEERAIDNAGIILMCKLIAERLDEVVDVALAANAANYAKDPHSGFSAAECGRLLGATKQAASQRRARGLRIMLDRIEAAGLTVFAEAKRERAAVKAAEQLATDRLGAERIEEVQAYRGRHLRAVA